MKTLKTLNLILMVLMCSALISCKSKKMLPVEPYIEPEVIEIMEPIVEEPVVVPVEEVPVVHIPLREERVSFIYEEDKVLHDSNRYFVIVGSFRNRNNAEKFVEQLKGQGFSPVILQSETGFNRVSVNSFSDDTPARAYVMEVRSRFRQYHDTWLLIKK